MSKVWPKDNPAAISEHCLAYYINLCLQEVTKSCKSIKEALNFLMEPIQLIKLSPKRQVMFESIQKQEEPRAVTEKILTLCPTRWTIRIDAMQVIITYKTMEMTMEEASHGTDDCSSCASSVAAIIKNFSTFFRLKISMLLYIQYY